MVLKMVNQTKKIILHNQPNKKGLCTVYLEQITHHNGERIRNKIATGIKVLPRSWSSNKQLILPSDNHHDFKNEVIQQKYLQLLNIIPSHPSSPTPELLNYLDQFIELKKSTGRKRSSYKGFITVRNRTLLSH